MKKVGFIGECMIELNGQAFGDMVQRFGGDTLNSALYLSRLDHRIEPYYISAVGNDTLSQQLLKLWHAEGINSSLTLLDSKHQTGLYQISLDEHGERSFTYWRKHSAASLMLQHDEFLTVSRELLNFDYLYLSGISIAILPNEDKDKLIALLADLNNHGVKIIFDSNYRPKLWDSQDQAKEYYRKIIPLCEYALLTFDDEVDLWADKSHRNTVDRLSKLELKKFVLKLGSEGCTYYSFENSKLIRKVFPTQKVEVVVDTTSAGDSFNAGFICELLRSESAEHGCELGNKLAGLVIQHKGAVIPKTITDLLIKY